MIVGTDDVCLGVGGVCDSGTCETKPLPEGSPCGSDPIKCGGTPLAENSCIDPDQPCVCNNRGRCEVNYLPVDTGCDHELPTEQCVERKCLEVPLYGGAQKAYGGDPPPVTCQDVPLNDSSACSGAGTNPKNPITCENAGECVEGSCKLLTCEEPQPPPETCGDQFNPGVCTRSCGSGNSDCDAACAAAEAAGGDLTCTLGANGRKKCRCSNEGGGQECTSSPKGFKCCTCMTINFDPITRK